MSEVRFFHRPPVIFELMNENPKQYLYHRVPASLEGDVLHPLNKLKFSERVNPKLYEVYKKVIEKYQSEYRKSIPNIKIPTLQDATWGDVLQMSPIHPEDLKKALNSAGFETQEEKFYQIDPDLLDAKLTTIYLYEDEIGDEDPENYTDLTQERLLKHSVVPQKTIDFYKKFKRDHPEKEFRLFFAHIPHAFYKGSIEDVSNLPVITVTASKKEDVDKSL